MTSRSRNYVSVYFLNKAHIGFIANNTNNIAYQYQLRLANGGQNFTSINVIAITDNLTKLISYHLRFLTLESAHLI